MNPALRDASALKVNLTVPSTKLRLGPVAIDGLAAFLGVDLASVLAPLLREAPTTRTLPGGGVVDVYPLAIPEGEGLSVPIKHVGDLGFRNFQSFLVLIVPLAIAEPLRERLSEEIASKQAAGPRFVHGSGGSVIAEFAVMLKPGMKKAIPLGTWGELGVEAA